MTLMAKLYLSQSSDKTSSTVVYYIVVRQVSVCASAITATS